MLSNMLGHLSDSILSSLFPRAASSSSTAAKHSVESPSSPDGIQTTIGLKTGFVSGVSHRVNNTFGRSHAKTAFAAKQHPKTVFTEGSMSFREKHVADLVQSSLTEESMKSEKRDADPSLARALQAYANISRCKSYVYDEKQSNAGTAKGAEMVPNSQKWKDLLKKIAASSMNEDERDSIATLETESKKLCVNFDLFRSELAKKFWNRRKMDPDVEENSQRNEKKKTHTTFQNKMVNRCTKRGFKNEECANIFKKAANLPDDFSTFNTEFPKIVPRRIDAEKMAEILFATGGVTVSEAEAASGDGSMWPGPLLSLEGVMIEDQAKTVVTFNEITTSCQSAQAAWKSSDFYRDPNGINSQYSKPVNMLWADARNIVELVGECLYELSSARQKGLTVDPTDLHRSRKDHLAAETTLNKLNADCAKLCSPENLKGVETCQAACDNKTFVNNVWIVKDLHFRVKSSKCKAIPLLRPIPESHGQYHVCVANPTKVALDKKEFDVPLMQDINRQIEIMAKITHQMYHHLYDLEYYSNLTNYYSTTSNGFPYWYRQTPLRRDQEPSTKKLFKADPTPNLWMA